MPVLSTQLQIQQIIHSREEIIYCIVLSLSLNKFSLLKLENIEIMHVYCRHARLLIFDEM